MKYIEIDDELYRHIASNTQRIGESASDILRRLLGLQVTRNDEAEPQQVSEPSLEKAAVATAPVGRAAVRSLAAEQGVFEEMLGDKALRKQKGAVGRFMYLLDAAYRQFPSSFDVVMQIQGRERLYFSTSKEALLNASKTANPKQIGASQYWVSANNNTRKKQVLLEEVLTALGCDSDLAEQIAQQI
ncbi:replication initiation negative regulator SeqA [Ferrimonas senticii]|uniref:replication initiation negative regulator SeqA n=1 Tax=Ferrimonas senticii TaxID=394566 RepID=UPI0003F5A2D5|nr:replication initiation negative regulator SeqA [Ferrimonas senticii]